MSQLKMEGIIGSMLKLKGGAAAVVDSEAAAISGTPGWGPASSTNSKEETKPVERVLRFTDNIKNDPNDPDKPDSCMDLTADSTYRAYVIGFLVSIALVVIFAGLREHLEYGIVFKILGVIVVIIGVVMVGSIIILQQFVKNLIELLSPPVKEEDEEKEEEQDEFVEIFVASFGIPNCAQGQDKAHGEGGAFIPPPSPKIGPPVDPEEANIKVDIEYVDVVLAEFRETKDQMIHHKSLMQSKEAHRSAQCGCAHD